MRKESGKRRESGSVENATSHDKEIQKCISTKSIHRKNLKSGEFSKPLSIGIEGRHQPALWRPFVITDEGPDEFK